ncbi:MAG: 5-formyltetrahydrofolate cyclo-ligase [Erysipelotrichaceae bacterium]|nr:5-formyltetrahydrofolate cyclo-ligase [Erysipelotrichaceae bacterium]
MKSFLRKQLRLKRNALSYDEVFFKSGQIMQYALPYMKKGSHVGLYASFDKEVDTKDFIAHMLTVGSVYLPKIENDELTFYQIEKDSYYQKNHYQIMEPISTKKIFPQQLDVIFIPLVGFNDQKHRLGYGKGYYDRYLKKTRAIKIGLAYECQHCDCAFQEYNDVALDMILTEKGVYR